MLGRIISIENYKWVLDYFTQLIIYCALDSDKRIIGMFESKFLRTINGEVCVDSEWRAWYNYELYWLYNDAQIRLGNLASMNEDSIVKRVFERNSDDRRREVDLSLDGNSQFWGLLKAWSRFSMEKKSFGTISLERTIFIGTWTLWSL